MVSPAFFFLPCLLIEDHELGKTALILKASWKDFGWVQPQLSQVRSSGMMENSTEGGPDRLGGSQLGCRESWGGLSWSAVLLLHAPSWKEPFYLHAVSILCLCLNVVFGKRPQRWTCLCLYILNVISCKLAMTLCWYSRAQPTLLILLFIFKVVFLQLTFEFLGCSFCISPDYVCD